MKCVSFLTKNLLIKIKKDYLFNLVAINRKMSSSNLKRNIEFDSLSSDKRSKLDDNLDLKNDDLDLNDYRLFRVKEEMVGITEFVSDNKGFKCDIKQRFSDFIVHELLTNGELSELTNQDDPMENLLNEIEKDQIIDEEIEELISLELKEKLKNLNDATETHSNDPILIDVDNKNKNQRTKIHKYVATYSSLESKTEDFDNKKMIKIFKINKTNENNSRNFNRNWPQNLPKYLHFTFYQENKGTTDAIADLAKKLKINVKSFGYAGLKDKRSISTQQVSLFKTLPKKLIAFNKMTEKYKFSSFTGDAIGNKFELVLRDVEFENENDVNQAIENVREHGFINYFGIQRFGHSEYPSYKVGIQLIKKQYKEAIDLILRYRQKDLLPPPKSELNKTFNECLKLYREKNDAKTAFKEFYWKFTNEGHLLKGLSLNNENYLNALINIPRNNRSFFCHSFQSFIWNQIASYRIRTYGLKLVKGDLVARRKDNSNNNDQVNLKYVRDIENEDVILIDDTNINDYTIFDVVLPLIGPQAKQPENLIKEEIKRLLDEFELNEDQINNVNDVFYIKGAYRRFLEKPFDLKYEIVKYDDNTIRLYDSDLDRLNNIKNSIESKGNKTAIKIEFKLPSSTYATVLIRELCRHNV